MVFHCKEKASLCQSIAQARIIMRILSKSCDGVAAKVTAFAGFAVAANPDVVELVHGLLNQSGVIGEDASFEVAGVLPFHADTSTCEVGTADLGQLAIEYQHLEMDSWTQHTFKAIEQSRVFVEVLTESGTRLLGVDETDFDTFLYELG